MSAKFPIASVHGRFQPLHLAHLEYILSAKRLCGFLWIGITKYQPDQMNPLGTHRERADANPLTYFERVDLITEALNDSGISRLEFGFIPFPIETPNILSNYLPMDVPCLTTICEEWNREKVRLLESVGYSVHVLWERPKTISASTIRKSILARSEDWTSAVPPATVRAVERLALRDRLVSMQQRIVPAAEPK